MGNILTIFLQGEVHIGKINYAHYPNLTNQTHSLGRVRLGNLEFMLDKG